MVAPKPGEPLLLYIAATAKVMSMVLVAVRLELMQPQALKGTPTARSRSPNPDPIERTHFQEASRSQLLGPTLNPKSGLNSQRCRQVLRTKKLSGPRSRSSLRPRQPARHRVLAPGGVLGSWGPRALSSQANGNRSTRPPPLGGSRPYSDRSTTSVRSSMMPR
jgi:hypothetical protein